MSKAFDKFAKRCAEAGLSAQDCGQGHWRIKGGVLVVNWYPMSKGSTIWINGTTGRTSYSGDAEMAIQAAQGNAPTLAPGARPTSRKRNMGWGRKIKKKWFNKGPVNCRWCRVRLDWHSTTIDHVVPLYRGGSNLEDNLAPACQSCNLRRGHELGAPK